MAHVQQRYYHPRRPRGSQSGRKRRGENLQVRAKEPLGTDSHRTISKNSSRCLLLIGHKKCFVLMCPMGEQFLLSSTDRQKQEVLKLALPEFDFAHACFFTCFFKKSNSDFQKNKLRFSKQQTPIVTKINSDFQKPNSDFR